MAIANATVGVTVKKKPFIWLWDVAAQVQTTGSILNSRLYTAEAAEKLLMAQVWFVAPASGKVFTFYKGDNDATTAVSHEFSSTTVGQITVDSLAFDKTQPHLEMLIGGDASLDLVLGGGATVWTLNMHIKLFFEE